VGQLLWSSDFKANQSGPVKLSFRFIVNRNPIGSDLLSEPKEVIFDGSPVSLDLGGLTVTVTGMASDGTLSYRLSGGLNDVPMTFAYQENTGPMIIYIYY
jgi:hypothetical protein